MRRPRAVVAAERDPLAELTVTGALAEEPVEEHYCWLRQQYWRATC